jgi:hypothetical protein
MCLPSKRSADNKYPDARWMLDYTPLRTNKYQTLNGSRVDVSEGVSYIIFPNLTHHLSMPFGVDSFSSELLF